MRARLTPALVLVLVLAGLVWASPVHAQSLVEASEAAKKLHGDGPVSGNARPARAFTNADLPATPATQPPVSAVAVAPSPATTTIGDGAKKTKAYWQARLMARVPQLAAATRALELATDSLRRAVILRNSMQTASSVAMADVSVRRATIDGERRLAEVRAAQAAIDAVHEEARRLGVLPGWLR
jgi:hypothetical protein